MNYFSFIKLITKIYYFSKMNKIKSNMQIINLKIIKFA